MTSISESAANVAKDKGNAAMNYEEYSKAIEHYSEAIRLNPNNHVFFSNRSAAYLNDGQVELALEDADTCIQLDPSFKKGYYRKGIALRTLDLNKEALSAFQEGQKRFPDDAEFKTECAKAQSAISMQTREKKLCEDESKAAHPQHANIPDDFKIPKEYLSMMRQYDENNEGAMPALSLLQFEPAPSFRMKNGE